MAAPQVNPNPQLQSYYGTLESRVGYRLLLGGTRHFGFWDHDTHWPFPLSRSLRRMEDKMAEALSLPRGSHVLDAGCGVGHVALRMATVHGLSVSAIDVVPHHVAKAQRNVSQSSASKKLPEGTTVTVQHADYHHLDFLPPESLDGVYTMETLVHATDPESVLAGFFRILKPGGHIALFEYDHSFAPDGQQADKEMADVMQKVNEYSAMPTNARSHPGVFKAMLEDAGFTDVEVRNYSENIKPMTRLFYALAIVPYVFVRVFGMEKRFVNTVAVVGSWKGRERWRYVAISAVKPGEASQ
ncbi:S-adenosyl-L-methionine-dependent methyltransferase [Cercophora newfieldiana]|uniref:S-adenosyl-L-methionine-dependent methyltransferase n=1 Tax=Cercophora newfieldiana TaxID=92897 RepID=A0AA39Y3X5_9PEZI|nr:S-adenosyl-L-methionine-dependent methyltransferase [Cercophora newfieldiana]